MKELNEVLHVYTEAEITKMLIDAYRSGRQCGKDEAYKEGYEAGKEYGKFIAA